MEILSSFFSGLKCRGFFLSFTCSISFFGACKYVSYLRWDLSPIGSAGPAHSQSQPGYVDQPPPQSSGFAIPSAPHCSGSLSGFKNLPGYFLSHVFHSSGMRERGGGKQFLRKLTFPVFSLCHFSKASLVAQSVKNQTAMQKTQILFLGQEDPLGKEMQTHSSILAWRIPWTAEPGRLRCP